MPPDRTSSVPPLDTVVSLAVPPADTISVPPLSTMVLLVVPLANTVSLPPLLTVASVSTAAGQNFYLAAAADG